MTAGDGSPSVLGDLIRAQRQMAKLSLRQLSVMAQVSNPYLSQVERGLHQPSVRVLRSIADALDVSTAMLLGQAGLISGDEGRDVCATASAIMGDTRLTPPQRLALLSVYRSYVDADTKDAPRLDAEPPGVPATGRSQPTRRPTP